MTASLDAWFGEVELGHKPSPAAVAVLEELAAMLDGLRPTLLDRNRSSVRAAGHGWTLEHSVVAHLAHATDADGDLDVIVGDKEAIVSWASAHEHVYPEEGDEQRPWTTVVVDALAAILRGEYVIEEHWRGARLVKVHIIDTADGDERLLSTTGSVLSWLPSRRPNRVERRTVSFGIDE